MQSEIMDMAYVFLAIGAVALVLVPVILGSLYMGIKEQQREDEANRKKKLEKRIKKGEDINQVREVEKLKQIDKDKGEKLKIKAKIGKSGVGFGFEHDDREQGSSPPVEDKTEQRLRKLANLRSQNLITEAEYQQRKREILNEI